MCMCARVFMHMYECACVCVYERAHVRLHLLHKEETQDYDVNPFLLADIRIYSYYMRHELYVYHELYLCHEL